MGQKHQMFLIARLFPKNSKSRGDSNDSGTDSKSESRSDERAYYRCIAAYHLQWCFKTMPLEKIAQFLLLLKNERNADIVKDEIRRVQFQYGRHGCEPAMPELPCPYTMLLLASSICTVISSKPEEAFLGFTFAGGILSPNMGSWDGDNNDGITVVDVTDPTNPAICFLLDQFWILTPRQYVEHYFNDLEAPKVKAAIGALGGVRLVTLDMLAEAWPDEYKSSEIESDEKMKGELEQEQEQEQDFQVEPETMSDSPDIVQGVPRLSDLMWRPAVEIASKLGDTSQLESFLWMPGKAELFREILRDQRPVHDGSVDLLIKVLQYKKAQARAKPFSELDLSGLHLSAKQIAKVVEDGDIVNSRPLAVDLSGNSILDKGCVEAVLNAFPNLKRLTMLNTGLGDDDLFELFSGSPKLFYGLSDLVHPALLQPPPDSKRKHYMHPDAFTLITRCEGRTSAASIPFFNIEKLLKCLIQCMRLISMDFEYASSGWIPSLVMSAGVHVTTEDDTDDYPLLDTDWEERTVACFPHLRTCMNLEGQGWFFVAKWTGGEKRVYGFVKAGEDKEGVSGKNWDRDEQWRIYDVRGFVEELGEEGRKLPDNTEVLLKKFEKELEEAGKIEPAKSYRYTDKLSLKWELVRCEEVRAFWGRRKSGYDDW